MKPRDQEYIENRLLSPADGALDAIDRLRQLGYSDEASTLMAAIQAFNDACRQVRLTLFYPESNR